MDEPVNMAYGGRMGYAFGTDSPEKQRNSGLRDHGFTLKEQ